MAINPMNAGNASLNPYNDDFVQPMYGVEPPGDVGGKAPSNAPSDPFNGDWGQPMYGIETPGGNGA